MKLGCASCFSDRLTETLPVPGILVLPVAQILADLIQHPLTNLDDQIGFLGQRDKFGRQNEPALRSAPSERVPQLSMTSPVLTLELWLVMHQQFIEFV